jgi:hypothetical protein
MTETVRAIIQQAMDTADRQSAEKLEKGAALARLLRDSGLRRNYKPEDFHKTVQSWARGDGMPPADVLLAAVKATGIHLDELLYHESLLDRLTRVERRLDEQGRQAEGEATDS